MEPVQRDLVHPRVSRPPPLKDNVRRIVDGMSQVMRDHAELARLEVREDVRHLARDAIIVGMAVPVALCAWLFANLALGWLLAMWITAAGGFAVVAALNAILAGILVAAGRSKLQKEEMLRLRATREELRRDREWLSDLRHPEPSVH